MMLRKPKPTVDIANNADKEILVRHPTAARRAFTMIEMLVVITIIALLVGLGILAYAHIDRATIQKATRADLQVAQSFIDEYNAGPGISQMGLGKNQVDASFPYKGGDFPTATPPNNNLPIGGASDDPQTDVLTGNVSTSGDQHFPIPNTPATPTVPMTVAWDYNYDPNNNGNAHNAIYNTGQAMVFLMRLPAVAQRISKVPSTKLLTIPAPSGNAQLAFTVTTGTLAGPIMLDGWGNPMIFVPAGGLVTRVSDGTNANGFKIVLVRSSGTIILNSSANSYTAKNPPPLKDNDHPFWASAGPDGDFYGSKTRNTNGGDDNIYSFQE